MCWEASDDRAKLCREVAREGLRRHAGFWGQSSGLSLGLVGVDRRLGHNDCAARRVQARRKVEARRPGRSRRLGGPGTRVLAQLRRRRPSAPGCEQRRRRCSRQTGGGRKSANGGERRPQIGDGRLDGGRARRRSGLLGYRGWLRRTRAAGRGQLRQVPVRPVRGKGASAASAGSGNGSHASTHACLAVVVGVDGSGRRCGLTAASGAWGSTAPGGSWLEGQEETRREEGPGGGGSGRVQQAEMTDGEGRRR